MLAGRLFDEQITRVASTADTPNGSRFPLGFDDRAETYFAKRTDGPAEVTEHPIQLGGAGADLVAALLRHWQSTGNDDLVELGIGFDALVEQLRAEAEEQSEIVDILCYTLF